MIQGSARMITPPGHAQPSLVSSSTTQYGEQMHTMYGKNSRQHKAYTLPAHLTSLLSYSASVLILQSLFIASEWLNATEINDGLCNESHISDSSK